MKSNLQKKFLGNLVEVDPKTPSVGRFDDVGPAGSSEASSMEWLEGIYAGLKKA